MISIDIIYR